MEKQGSAHALAALSARVTTLEAAVHALTQGSQLDREKVPAESDGFGRELLDRRGALPVDERAVELMEESFRDVRSLPER